MNNNFLKLETKLGKGFICIAFIYFLISLYYFVFKSEAGGGDEGLFINDLLYIKKEGWVLAIEKSISIPYMLLTFPFSFFLQDYLALRIANVFLLLILIFYFYKVVKIKAYVFYGYLFFYLGTVHYFFVGTNDVLFFVGLIIFMTESFYFLEYNKINNQIFAFSGLIVSFFTRELIWVYMPLILLTGYFLYKQGFPFFNKLMIVPVLLFFIFIIFNIPSLTAKGKLSYDEKVPSSSVKATWSQRQYLAQLLVNKGELQNFSHPSWEQTDLYLEKNGVDSLPNGVLKGLTFDYSLTFKEFFKDFFYSILFGFRQLGLILFFPFYFLAINLKKSNILSPKFYFPYALILIFCVFSLIVISYIEARWYISVFIVSIIFYNKYQTSKKIDVLIIVINYLILTCFSIYSIYNLLHKFIGIV